jgi:predicted metalloprotease with PDZ domain
MKTFVLLLLSPLLVLSAQREQTADTLEYTINYSAEDSPQLAVGFSYTGDSKGEILLRYENDSWGDKDIFNCIGSFTVSPESANVEFLRDSSLIRITTLPHRKADIHYSIVQDFTDTLKNYHRYRPIITQDYFHLLGMRLFMLPKALFKDDNSKATLKVVMEELPGEGIFHSSFGPEKQQTITGTREQLYASFFVGGDFRRYAFDYKGKQVYFVSRGDWKMFTDEDVFKVLQETIAFQYDFWKDTIESRYSVSLIPTFEEWTETSKSFSIGGSGLTDSFISFASNNEGTQLKPLVWLYNHELFHKWVGLVIKNESEEKQYWFSEGFTDYYAYKLMLKNDKMTLEDMVTTLNKEVLQPHYSSEVREVPNEEITFEKFWGDVNYHKLPYRRGLLYALLTDFQIKERSGYTQSLDRLMFDLLKMAREDEDMRFNEEVFKGVLLNYLDESALADFEEHILRGRPLTFGPELPEGLTVKVENGIPQFHIAPGADMAKLTKAVKF